MMGMVVLKRVQPDHQVNLDPLETTVQEVFPANRVQMVHEVHRVHLARRDQEETAKQVEVVLYLSFKKF